MALKAWIRALSEPSVEAVERACAEGIAVHRYTIFEDRGSLAEVISGHEAVLAWLKRSPEGITWSIESDDGKTARYALEVGDFNNGGVWHYKLDEDGKLLELHHHADAISQEPPPLPPS